MKLEYKIHFTLSIYIVNGIYYCVNFVFTHNIQYGKYKMIYLWRKKQISHLLCQRMWVSLQLMDLLLQFGCCLLSQLPLLHDGERRQLLLWKNKNQYKILMQHFYFKNISFPRQSEIGVQHLEFFQSAAPLSHSVEDLEFFKVLGRVR